MELEVIYGWTSSSLLATSHSCQHADAIGGLCKPMVACLQDVYHACHSVGLQLQPGHVGAALLVRRRQAKLGPGKPDCKLGTLKLKSFPYFLFPHVGKETCLHLCNFILSQLAHVIKCAPYAH